jgi:hypothetical protein
VQENVSIARYLPCVDVDLRRVDIVRLERSRCTTYLELGIGVDLLKFTGLGSDGEMS